MQYIHKWHISKIILYIDEIAVKKINMTLTNIENKDKNLEFSWLPQ